MGVSVASPPVRFAVGIRGPARAPLAAHREVESDRREDRTVDCRADGGVAGGAGGAVVGILMRYRRGTPPSPCRLLTPFGLAVYFPVIPPLPPLPLGGSRSTMGDHKTP